MKHALILLTILIGGLCNLEARTLPKVKRPVRAAVTEVFDTIQSPRADAVRFSGYEKTNPSTKETFFATNDLGSDSTITAMEVVITYYDLEGRQLHERTEMIKCLIPPGETRALSLRAWDANHAFHYYLSTPPRSRRSSPFKVTSRLHRLVLTSPDK